MNDQLFLKTLSIYTNRLVDLMTTHIYEGLEAIYAKADSIAKERGREDQTFIIFQNLLQGVNDWNKDKIERETIRIKTSSHSQDHFDKLVKMIVKCNLILTTYSNNPDKSQSPILRSFYETFETSTFVHRCYSLCAKQAHMLPYLFERECEPLDIKRNQIIMTGKIEKCISVAAEMILPYAAVLDEFDENTMDIIPAITNPNYKKTSFREDVPVHRSSPSQRQHVSNRPASAQTVRLNRDVQQILREPSIRPTADDDIMNIIQADKRLSSIKINGEVNNDIMAINPRTPGRMSASVLEVFGIDAMKSPAKPY